MNEIDTTINSIIEAMKTDGYVNVLKSILHGKWHTANHAIYLIATEVVANYANCADYADYNEWNQSVGYVYHALLTATHTIPAYAPPVA